MSFPADQSGRVATERTGRIVAARALTKRSRRTAEGAFLAEGPQAVREAIRFSDHVRRVFVDEAAADRHTEILNEAHAKQIPIVAATAKAIASLSETVTPQGIVAECETFAANFDSLLQSGPRLLAVPVDVRDPGNAGTIIRTADAAGADGVVVAGDAVDIFNGKAVRASAGSIFHLPVAFANDPLNAIDAMKKAGLRVIATEGEATTDLDTFIDAGGLDGPVAWLFGNEARGLDESVAQAADERIAIPIRGHAESLNLATAAAVCLFATARAHRTPSRTP